MDSPRRSHRPLGVLVVGVGFLGAQRARACRVARGVRLAAVTDSDADRASRLAARLRVPAVSSLDAGLALPGVDAVIVATPHADHHDAVRAALEAGKAVLCEKPLAIDPDEARDLARLADDRGLTLATGFNHRFYAPVRDALGLVASGRLGPVESVQATIGHAADPAFLQGWHTDRAVSGGGSFMDNGPHACDLARRFLGEVTTARGGVRDELGLPLGVESEAVGTFFTKQRNRAEVRSSWTLSRGYLTIEVCGDSGFLRIETAPWKLSGVLADGSRVERTYLRERIAGRLHHRLFGCERSLVSELEAFGSADAHRPGLLATGWDGVRASEMVDAVYRAAERGGEVALAPAILRAPHRARGVSSR